MNSASPRASWKDRLAAELRRDKKKTAILSALTVVAAVLVVRALLPRTPQTARASAVALMAQPVQASARPVAAVPVKPAQPAARPKKAKKTELASIDQFSREIKRDIFRLNETLFPPEKPVKPVETTTKPADAPDPDAHARIIRAQASALLLESVIMSGSPVAIINGRPRQVGQTIGEFQVVKITEGGCIVSKDGVEIALVLKDQQPKYKPFGSEAARVGGPPDSLDMPESDN